MILTHLRPFHNSLSLGFKVLNRLSPFPLPNYFQLLVISHIKLPSVRCLSLPVFPRCGLISYGAPDSFGNICRHTHLSYWTTLKSKYYNPNFKEQKGRKLFVTYPLPSPVQMTWPWSWHLLTGWPQSSLLFWSYVLWTDQGVCVCVWGAQYKAHGGKEHLKVSRGELYLLVSAVSDHY